MTSDRARIIRQLECYEDDALPAAERDALNAALRRDPELRSLLAGVRRVDEAARSALLAEADALTAREHASDPDAPQQRLRRNHTVRRTRGRFVPVSVAACIAAVIGMSWSVWSASGRAHSDADSARIVAAPGAEGTPNADTNPAAQTEGNHRVIYQPVRVVLSVPVRRDAIEVAASPAAAAHEPGGDDPSRLVTQSIEADERRYALALDAALHGGDVDRVLAMIENATPEARRRAYRRLGDVLHSALDVAEVLDQLSSRQQVIACGEWAEVSSFRAYVFSRLNALSRDPDVSADVQDVVARLARVPQITPWLRSFRLRASPGRSRGG